MKNLLLLVVVSARLFGHGFNLQQLEVNHPNLTLAAATKEIGKNTYFIFMASSHRPTSSTIRFWITPNVQDYTNFMIQKSNSFSFFYSSHFAILNSISFYYEFSKEQDYICSKPEDSGMHKCPDLPPYRHGPLTCNGKHSRSIDFRFQLLDLL